MKICPRNYIFKIRERSATNFIIVEIKYIKAQIRENSRVKSLITKTRKLISQNTLAKLFRFHVLQTRDTGDFSSLKLTV